MKYLLISVLIAVGLCSRTNTTNFFNEKVGHNTTIESWSGYEPIDWYYPESTASMYYSFWKVLGEEKITDPYTSVIIWLQGGPGAPSQFGCFNEVGPFHITGDSNFNVQYNSYSWNEIGHLVCVDQPVGIGFSYNRAKMVTDTHEASAHFLNFLYNFLNEWDLWKNPLYIAGESYAGHYIPAFVQKMLQNTTLNFNLKGVMIGDGYLDPINQVNFYDSMMYSLGVASEYARDTTTYIQNQAVLSLLNNKHQDATNWADWIVDNDDNNRKFYGGLNLMNYKKYTQDNINDNYWKFLQENKKSFGVPDDVNYIDDGEFMYKAFGRDISMSFADSLVYVLRNVRTLIYNGQNDVIVNTAGVLNYLNNLDWEGTLQWSKTPKTQWRLFNTNVGWKKIYGNLNFVLIRNAGHLVPADQAQAAINMIKQFIQGV